MGCWRFMVVALRRMCDAPLTLAPLLQVFHDHFFIDALNSAMEVFPRDRPQTAREWVNMIDQAKRQKAMAERAEKDEALDVAIRELTMATNREIMTDPPEAPAAPRRMAKALAASVAKPRNKAVPAPPSAEPIPPEIAPAGAATVPLSRVRRLRRPTNHSSWRLESCSAKHATRQQDD